MRKTILSFLCIFFFAFAINAQNPIPKKPRILISSDIGGTDADDNQSMAHLLMYNEMFDIEGLVSSPSFGNGSKEEILRMIDIYAKDYPKLKQHVKDLKSPDELKVLCKQGRKGGAPYCGYEKATEGSNWIVECARKKSNDPLWVLVWGGIEDVAQALHDAPDIQKNIRVYWIGGPNKKWSVNAYSYIAENFPNLWIIENNASYRGFIHDSKKADKFNTMYYDKCILGAGNLGKDFKNYYNGFVKMGDTPSLLYMMDGNPNDPSRESWGGSFEKMSESPKVVFTEGSTLKDTVPVYSVIEYRFRGPNIRMISGTKCFVFNIGKQNWDGVYLGNGIYGVKYSPKAPETLSYSITSDIKNLNGLKGSIVVSGKWPGKHYATSYKLGNNWYTDKSDPSLFGGAWQGFKTTEKWRNSVLIDWEKRWSWLKDNYKPSNKIRTIVTSDGEIDDECSMVRFLLYTNEWDVEAIITSSSQYHWHGHKWAGDNWLEPHLDAYAKVYPNLVLHDSNYPTPEYLRSVTFLGNVETEGEMDIVTPGSQRIVKVLLDETDNRPVWIQAWGGTNTLARALKTIEEDYPDKMQMVANKLRFYFIWEQDGTYQSYIRPHWGKYNIKTIICDQFEAIAYRWKMVQPENMQKYFEGPWMKEHILNGHGELCSGYKANKNGDFRSEGDSPSFIYLMDIGLSDVEHPDWGNWGGRFVKVRENTWLDPVPEKGYEYPKGRWYGSNGWGRSSLRPESKSTKENRDIYFKQMYRWSDALQNDFAARAEWCVKPYNEANHAPIVKLANANSITAKAGEKIKLSANGTTDPDGNQLAYNWWNYTEASSYQQAVKIKDNNKQDAVVTVPKNAKSGDTIHVICQVTDNGTPAMTRYQRVVITVK